MSGSRSTPKLMWYVVDLHAGIKILKYFYSAINNALCAFTMTYIVMQCFGVIYCSTLFIRNTTLSICTIFKGGDKFRQQRASLSKSHCTSNRQYGQYGVGEMFS